MPLLLLLLHSDRIIYILITLQTYNPLKPESNLTPSCSAKENKDLPLLVTYYCANIMWLLCSRLVCDWQTGNTQEGRLSSGVSYTQTLSPPVTLNCDTTEIWPLLLAGRIWYGNRSCCCFHFTGTEIWEQKLWKLYLSSYRRGGESHYSVTQPGCGPSSNESANLPYTEQLLQLLFKWDTGHQHYLNPVHLLYVHILCMIWNTSEHNRENKYNY